MRLPGTRYQEPGWEDVRKLLGQCSLVALRACDPAHWHAPEGRADALARYVEQAGRALRALRGSARAAASGNSYGDTVAELATGLLYELQARPGDWDAFCAAAADPACWTPAGEGLLRKKVNDMYALLRDKVDADNYQAACGRPCSPNRMYAYRMLDTAHGEIARLFAGWEQHRAQVGAILGRALHAAGAPIETRQLRSIADCRPEWVLRWSETLEAFGGAPGPLHTRSKRFASLKSNPARIGAMLREIGDYEALSANRDRDWLQDLDDASAWVEDYWRVLQDAHDAATPGPDRILEAAQDELDAGDGEPADEAATDVVVDPLLREVAAAVSLPPGFMEEAAAAESRAASGRVGRLLADDGLPVRLAVYARLLGPDDDAYPDAWRDPATGALPTMQQLAALARVSLPTLRKRRDAAVARLQDALGAAATRTQTREVA
ncbi:hypothetical protein [uncultured Massilia sp.]|uniref:hypothetical protein n=1 Tax=uncultured Massilia sp. TaxID=169973 RepID=UPI0025F7D6A7|nr:hypothetical protein [uncultured Massilia sp.]